MLGQDKSLTKLRRSFPLTERLSALLLEQKKDCKCEKVFHKWEKVHPGSISRMFARLRSQIENFPKDSTIHTLRHTFASHLIMAGVDISTVASMLGHSTTKTTELYAHLQPDHIKLAATKLPY